jgi:hypothetical protein
VTSFGLEMNLLGLTLRQPGLPCPKRGESADVLTSRLPLLTPF